MFKTICVDHVGIACKDLDLSKKFYTEVLGLSCTGEEAVPEQGVILLEYCAPAKK